MSLSSTASPSRSATGPRAVRTATAMVVAVVLLFPAAVLFAQVWTSTGDKLSFSADERRGVAYLGPLTRLLSAVTDAQSTAVRGEPVDASAVEAAVAAVDAVDARLGSELRSTDRWTAIRAIVRQRTAQRAWATPADAYTQYSDLVTTLMALNRKVADASRLILDPELDGYYVMNAAVLRIPEILVDSGRYADLSVLGDRGPADEAALAQLTAARNRVAINAADLGSGLETAFGDTDSVSLGAGLTRPLDDFRTAVDAVAPSTSLLAPAPQRSLSDLRTDQDRLRGAALTVQSAALDELDQLLADRQSATWKTRWIAVGAVVLGLLLAGAAVALLLRRRPRRRPAEPVEDDVVRSEPGPLTASADGYARRHGPRAGPLPEPGLVGALGPEPRGGARAAR